MLKKTLGSLVKIIFLALLVAFLVILSEVLAFGLSSNNTVFSPSRFVTDHSEWPTVEGTVFYYSGRDSEGYVDVTFDYEVNGESYRCTQSWHGEEHVYSAGENLTVYYDPENPYIAVIEPGKSQWALETLLVSYVLFPVLLIGAGLVYAWIVVWAWVSNIVSHGLEGGREVAVLSLSPNRWRIWCIIGVIFGLVYAADTFGLSIFLRVFFGVFLITPVVLAILLEFKSFQNWLSPRLH